MCVLNQLSLEQNKWTHIVYFVELEINMYPGPLLVKWCPKQDCIIVPPSSNIMEVKKYIYNIEVKIEL